MKIFVSYTTRDAIVTATSLFPVAETLERIGKPYVDVIHNDSADKQSRVERELMSSSLVFLLESSSIQESPWVKWELDNARRLGIPIKSIDVSQGMPSAEQILRVFQG
ncbi:hypothetical protein BCT47_00275 [Vibrio splendidus]|uniref:TIR domain-containing protein n=1 Tax=Vibrio splendidus TaxID=29497 RepID=A0AB35MW17_VIBSP|nr:MULTISPECIES: hypothetical protein [Vibrio]MDP2500741.1 hypothetical protein [Vibrio splendidus]PMG52722.1 hypothetical protein BCU88_21965 [Vibrio splendidus]PMH60257.1 hypothetical protein BCU64_19305 [Vibrio lentus]PMM77905.1 hypothetical protein BCT47_00275 [Vibrio splendidus]